MISSRWPEVVIWPDSLGLRPPLRELDRRIAAEGYSAADREKYFEIVDSFVAPGAAERDGVAYVAFLDAQAQVAKQRKIGTHGYCLGGPFALKTAAVLPERVGAGASFHGGPLVTEKAIVPTCSLRESRRASTSLSHRMTMSANPM